MRSEVYGSVFVCLCRLLQLLNGATKSFYRLSHVFLDCNL